MGEGGESQVSVEEECLTEAPGRAGKLASGKAGGLVTSQHSNGVAQENLNPWPILQREREVGEDF